MERLLEIIFEFFPILIGVLIFLFRTLGKKNTSPEAKKPSSEKTSSFDDLLKQITQQLNENQNPNKTAEKQSSQSGSSTKSLSSHQNTEKGLSKAEREKDQHFSPYQTEKKKKKIKQQQEVKLSSINEKQAKEIGGVEKGLSKSERNKDQHFNPYSKVAKPKKKYALMLQDKNKLKDAIILNEVFKRKYF